MYFFVIFKMVEYCIVVEFVVGDLVLLVEMIVFVVELVVVYIDDGDFCFVFNSGLNVG